MLPHRLGMLHAVIVRIADRLTVEIIVLAEHPTAVGAQEREVGLVKCLDVEEGVGEVGGKHLIQSKCYI